MGVKRLVFGKAPSLRGAAQRDDGEVRPSFEEPDARDSDALQHFLPSSVPIVDLMRSVATESGVRTMLGVPLEEDGELRVESVSLKWDDDPSRALVLHGQDQPLDQADAPMLPDSSVARPDTLRLTPGFEAGAVELLFLVADQIPRSLTGVVARLLRTR